MAVELYPLKFTPILKDKIWGGNKLKVILNKPGHGNKIGESWELSDLEGNISVVSRGPLAGLSLKELINTYKGTLVGEKVYQEFGDKFPLLLKFIDAKENLSVQLHPNDNIAAELHNSFGKTEMWYVVQADESSELIVGFEEGISKSDYLHHLENNSLSTILNHETVSAGDSFFIEVGRVHAIGAGILLAEIQQTSDITYRIYDWDRTDDKGNPRELHTDLALKAIDFGMKDDFKRPYKENTNSQNNIVKCRYFTTNFVHITDTYKFSGEKDSFRIYMNVLGSAIVHGPNGKTDLNYGETILIPASINSFQITSTNAKLLEVYI